MAQIDPGIFKAYDIRGIVDQTLTKDACRHIGRAFATLARQQGLRAVNISRDGRLSGAALAQALSDGLRASPGTVATAPLAAASLYVWACTSAWHSASSTGRGMSSDSDM